MPALMAAGYIRERNGRYYIRTRVQVIDPDTGQSRWKHVERAAGPSRRGAERMLRTLQEQVQARRYIPCRATVLDLGNRWLTEHVQPNLKPGAAASYRGAFYKHIAPAIGHLRVEDCDGNTIRNLLAAKRREGMSEQGVAKLRRHLHAMFAFAQDAGLVSVNPADAARARGGRNGQRRARGTELSPVQLRRFLQECSPRWRPFFTVALDTGLRRGELIGLRWEDVDLLERVIHVRRSIGPYDEPERPAAPNLGPELGLVAANGNGSSGRDHERVLTTKTDAGKRLVPILDGAQRALEELYAVAEDPRDEAPVFATVERKRGHDGRLRPTGRPLCPRMVSRVFRRYAQRAGLPESVRLHDLRHTAITNAIGQGEDILLVAAFAGHAKTSTTVDVYGHLMPERVRQAARRMRSISDGVLAA
ncbi:MAG TPA: site-specific integrase [Solirubrobacteraceae bacterium]|nr:site-specific integrase [Solirubrobacteraceae bacterium]